MAARLALRFWRNQAGATAIEYGIIVALIFVVIVTGLTAMANSNGGMYGKIKTFVGGALD